MSRSTEVIIPISGLTGMNKIDSANKIQDTEAVLLENWEPSRYGTLRKRDPIKNLADTGIPASSWSILGHFDDTVIAYTSGGEICLIEGNGIPSNYQMFGETLNSDMSSEVITGYVRYNNVGYVSTRDGKIWTFNGTTFTQDATSVPSGANGLVVFKDRLFAWGSGVGATDSSRVYYSEATDFSTWDPAGFFDVNPGDNDQINHICVYQDRLVIFKTHTMWVMTHAADPANWALRLINNAYGGYTCVEANALLYVSTKYGIYATDTLQFKNISEPIGNPAEATLVYIHEKRCLFVNTTTNFEQWTYHFDTAGWSKRTFDWPSWSNTIMMTPFKNVLPGVYVAGTYDYGGMHQRYIFQLDLQRLENADLMEYTAGPTPNHFNIAARMMTKRYDMGNSESMKRGKYTFLESTVDREFYYHEDTATHTTFQYHYNEPGFIHPDPAEYDPALQPTRESEIITLDEMRGATSYKLPGPGYFREIQVEIVDDGNAPIELDAISLVLQAKRALIFKQTA